MARKRTSNGDLLGITLRLSTAGASTGRPFCLVKIQRAQVVRIQRYEHPWGPCAGNMSPLADPMIEAPTQIYLPDIQYPGGYDVVVEVATWQATGQQKIAVIAAKGRTVIVMVQRR